MPHSVILASISPHRRWLLKRLQVPFGVTAPKVDEEHIPGEPPAARALRLAEAKARDPAVYHPQALIIGGDQTVCGGGEIFDKPGTAARAAVQLRAMSGRRLEFFTAAAVYDAAKDRMQSRMCIHMARFRKLSPAEITRYVRKEPAFNCAGGAQIEGLGVSLLESIDGRDPAAVVGISLIDVCAMFRACDLRIP